jgi:membrane protein DedA with SNARE-associated domain
MSITSTIFNFAVNLIQSIGYAGVFVLMVLESATLPVPSEIVLPLAGYVVYQGNMNFWLAVVVASLGSLVGTSIDFAIGFYLGRPAILRYGRIVGLNEGHLKTSEKWFSKFGEPVVLLARFVPLIRTLIAFPAGIAEMKVWKFLLFSAVGIVTWDAILVYVGYLAGSNVDSIINSLNSIFGPVEIVAGIAGLIILVLLVRRHGSKQSAVEPATTQEEASN